MIADVVRALGRGLPPRRFVVGFVGLMVAVTIAEVTMQAAITWCVGGWNEPELAEMFARPRLYNAGFVMTLFCVGLWRAGAFNPALDSRYYRWLRTTPWTAAQPLPLGPVHLMWQDALLVAAAMGLWSLEGSPLLLPLAFALPYCGLMTSALFQAGQLWSVCGAAALGVSLLLTINRPEWQAAAVAIGSCVYCDWAFRRALREFPWEGAPGFASEAPAMRVPSDWPRLQSSVTDNEPALRWQYVAAISLLLGWVALVLATLYVRETAATVSAARSEWRATGLLFLAGAVAAFGRFVCYANERASPLGPWARLRLGRWIIPGYDRVFVAPLAILATGGLLPQALFWIGAPLPVVASATIAVLSLVTLGAGPTLAEWSLTGEYRLEAMRPGRDWVQLA